MVAHDYVVMLTQRCNFRCTYCYQTHASVDQELEVIERLAAFLRQKDDRGSKVIFHGGEPLLRKDLVRRGISLLLGEDGVPVCTFGIVTNGSLIDDEMIELFCRYRFDVNVSFDGCREAQAFRILRPSTGSSRRCGGSFRFMKRSGSSSAWRSP